MDYAWLGLLFLFFRSYTFHTNLYLLLILKCLPVLLTSYSTFQKNKVMGYGFLFCAIGDLFLQLDDSLHFDLYFIIGLVSFLIGHHIFTLAFRLQKCKNISPYAMVFRTILLVIMVLVLKPVVTAINLTGDSVLAVAVVYYGCAISLMADASFSIYHSYGNTYALLGSLVFVLSDSLLAFHKFVFELNALGGTTAVLFTYYLAIGLLGKATYELQPKSKQLAYKNCSWYYLLAGPGVGIGKLRKNNKFIR